MGGAEVSTSCYRKTNRSQVGRGVRGEGVMQLPKATQQGTRSLAAAQWTDIEKRMARHGLKGEKKKLKVGEFFFF